MNKYQDPERKDWVIGIALLVIYVLAISLGAVCLLPEYWWGWLLIVFGGMLYLVLRQTKNYACRCRKCGHEFEISFLVNLLAPHGVDKEGSWEWVRCPACEKRTKSTVIRIVKTKS
ncbi:MAG TPA: hypothetical protein DEH25_04970 [Chloroflexi bacterium]|nr:hypothetical protein [Chloroflexota bacterium]